VFTDHVNLQYYWEPHKIPAQVHSWNGECTDYNIKIIYKPGASNHTDALSWRPDHGGHTSNDDEITALKPDLFSLDTPEWQALTAAIDLDDDQDLEKEIWDAQKHFPAMDQWTDSQR